MPQARYDVFLSYASADLAWTAKLKDDLEQRGIQVFFGPRDIEAGEKYIPLLAESIENSETFAVVVSPDSMQSAWVEDECGRAQSLTNLGKTPTQIIPLIHRPATPRAFLGERQIIDFTLPDQYQANLERLAYLIKPTHVDRGRPGDGAWIEYSPKELRHYAEDLARILRYLVKEQHPDGDWFHATRWSEVATAQVIELLSRVHLVMRRLRPGDKRYAALLHPCILRAVQWLLGQLGSVNDDFGKLGDDLWDRGFIARSLLYASSNTIVPRPTLEELRGPDVPAFRSLVQHLIAEHSQQPWLPSEEGSWSGAGFLGPLLMVADWTGARTANGRPWEEALVAEVKRYLQKDTATLGATDPRYYAWHAGNVVDAMQEVAIPIDDKARAEILHNLVAALPQSADEVIWAVGTPDRERSLIANWGAIALTVLYGPHHRNVRTTLNYLQRRFFDGPRNRFDDAKTAVCYGQALYSFLRQHEASESLLSTVIDGFSGESSRG